MKNLDLKLDSVREAVEWARSIGDSHLLALKSYGKASILTPLQFLKKFQEELSP